jgi:uncharacterized protein
MRFNPKARLNTSQVRDTRGRRAGGFRGGGMGGGLGGGLGGLPIGVGAGGGVVGIIIVAAIVLFFFLGNGSGSPTAGPPNRTSGAVSTAKLAQECRTGADTVHHDCRLVAEINSIQSYWTKALPQQAGVRYVDADTRFFTGQVSTGCGNATEAVGPFYCPADKIVYIDLSFFNQMLTGQLGAEGGDFAEAYVLAHEYGHHVQDLLGTMSKVHSSTGATSDSVRLELQADCYAGMWAKGATSTTDAGGRPLILNLTANDIARAINAAKAVGDNRIQRESTGRVNPDAWTHGSSAERMRWFLTGYHQGSLKACDTFSAQHL